jgi:hypothetical protein
MKYEVRLSDQKIFLVYILLFKDSSSAVRQTSYSSSLQLSKLFKTCIGLWLFVNDTHQELSTFHISSYSDSFWNVSSATTLEYRDISDNKAKSSQQVNTYSDVFPQIIIKRTCIFKKPLDRFSMLFTKPSQRNSSTFSKTKTKADANLAIPIFCENEKQKLYQNSQFC